MLLVVLRAMIMSIARKWYSIVLSLGDVNSTTLKKPKKAKRHAAWRAYWCLPAKSGYLLPTPPLVFARWEVSLAADCLRRA